MKNSHPRKGWLFYTAAVCGSGMLLAVCGLRKLRLRELLADLFAFFANQRFYFTFFLLKNNKISPTSAVNASTPHTPIPT